MHIIQQSGTCRSERNYKMAQFSNFASLSYSGGRIESNTVTGELVEVLTASKNALGETYGARDDVSYVVSLVNSGTVPLDGLVVTDDLGAYTLDTQTLYPLEYVGGSVRYYQNGVLQTAPTVTAAGELVISGISVPAEGNTIIIYKTRLTDYAPLGIEASITNTATISGNVTPITASATINMNARAELGISKSVCPTSVTENGRLTYTFVIQNSGSIEATASDSIVLSDLFDPVLGDITAMLNGNALTSPTDYTYDETTGQFTSVAGSITVPAATYTQGTDGRWTVTPGTSVLTISGKV